MSQQAHKASSGTTSGLAAPPAAEATIAQPLGPSLFLAGGLCVLPFLLPYNQPFQAEWLATALGVAASLAALARHGASVVSLPTPARWLLAFALFLGLQIVFGHPIYLQLPFLASLYALYAALLLWLGAQLAVSNGIEGTTRALAACLLVGAVANAAAGAIQFYGLPDLLKDIVAELGHNPLHNGAYGNIAQANLYANYLALGATALLFLWLRGSLRTAYALAAALLLAWACALSGSRGALLYALWFALLGALAGRMPVGAEGRRLKLAAYGLAAIMLAAQLAVPWFNHALHLGPAIQGTFERLADISSSESRWQIWLLAWRVFADAPLAGAGIGEFAGAAFESGLSPSLTRFGNQVWTSAHNLPLHLLAETGALGTFLALAGLCTWCWQVSRRYLASAQAEIWWIIAAVGIELIHSMFEFPLWNAHFLGVTALLLGLGTRLGTSSHAESRLTWTAAAGTCMALALVLAILLKDYVRLSTTRITGTTLTLASSADAERDGAVMRSLTRGLLAPAAEYWIILGAPLDRGGLAARLEMSERVARHYPTHAIIVRRAVFLAFDGRAAEARRLLARALYTFPKRCNETIRILALALASDPGAIQPLLSFAKRANRGDCI
ncbi:MAG: Wzy polymerase domain-containing protein [Pseudomonadota bacterium]